MPDTVLLVDGMYLIFSSFYANRTMRTLEGKPTGAVYGFVMRMEKMIRELRPRFLAVAFDSPGKTFRHGWYDLYKAKRLEPPEELVQQIPDVKEYLRLRGIDAFEEPGFEGDDIIAAITRERCPRPEEVLICSADKDLFQLVGGNVFLYHPKYAEKMNGARIEEVFGVSPERIVDYLSLTGDASDNIPGVPGIGDKTAKKLIDEHGDLDRLLDHLSEVEERHRSRIADHLELLRISRRLLDLNRAPALDREFHLQPFTDRVGDDLLELYRRLAFRSLLKSAPRTAPPERQDMPFEVLKRQADLSGLRTRLEEAGSFAFDLETTGVDFIKSRIIGLSVVCDDRGFYLSFAGMSGQEIEYDFDDFRDVLGPVFADPGIGKTGHNLKFDTLHLRRHGVMTAGIRDDTMVMAYLLYPNRRAHALKDLTLELLNQRQTTFAELTDNGRTPLDEVDLARIARYCVDDSYFSLRLRDALAGDLESKQLKPLYEEVEIPLIEVLAGMEFTGVRIDAAFLKEAAARLNVRIREVEEDIYTQAGLRFNINSSQQLGELLFEKMGLPVSKRTRKTKTYSTDIEVLSELKGFPIVESVIQYRTFKKMHSTYLEGLIKHADEDQRVHSSFNQTVTATGRLSSSNPNLQNIPVGEQAGIDLRRAFIASGPDTVLLAADYSQIELRVMAHFSRDSQLIDAFERDFDIHQHTADRVFGDQASLDPRERRKRAKIINFSVLYGSGPYSLSKELGVGYAEAKAFIDRYYEKYTGVAEFIRATLAAAEADPEVRTLAGRRRPIPEINSANKTVRENGKRMAVNTIIQGSAADIIKIAMVKIHHRLRGLGSRLILQVHDELVFECPRDEEDALIGVVREEMEQAADLAVPLKVSLKRGANWGEMEPI